MIIYPSIFPSDDLCMLLLLIAVPFQEAGRSRVNLRQHVHELIKVARDRRLKFPEGPLRDAVDELTQVARSRLYLVLETQPISLCPIPRGFIILHCCQVALVLPQGRPSITPTTTYRLTLISSYEYRNR